MRAAWCARVLRARARRAGTDRRRWRRSAGRRMSPRRDRRPRRGVGPGLRRTWPRSRTGPTPQQRPSPSLLSRRLLGPNVGGGAIGLADDHLVAVITIGTHTEAARW